MLLSQKLMSSSSSLCFQLAFICLLHHSHATIQYKIAHGLLPPLLCTCVQSVDLECPKLLNHVSGGQTVGRQAVALWLEFWPCCVTLELTAVPSHAQVQSKQDCVKIWQQSAIWHDAPCLAASRQAQGPAHTTEEQVKPELNSAIAPQFCVTLIS